MNIVITGVSRGIGYHLALQFLKDASNKVFGLTRDEKGLRKIAEVSKAGERFVGIRCDITEEKNVGEAAEKIRGKVSGIELMINNAGRLINKPFAQLSKAEWRSVYDVNVFAVVNVTQQFLPMLESGELSKSLGIKAHIVNITSMGGVQGSVKFAGLSAYSSSKGALITMSECLSEELKMSGIRVNCIALGSVETEMFREAFPGMKASANSEEMAGWIGEFAMNGYKFFNGKVIQASTSTP